MRGDRLEALRKKKGWSRQDLANKIGVSINAIYRWEKSERGVTEDNLLKLAMLLNTSSSYLIGEIEYSGLLNEYSDEFMLIGRKSDGDTINLPIVGRGVIDVTGEGGIKPYKVLAIESYLSVPKHYIKDFITGIDEKILRIIRMGGDSMEPRYREGEALLYAQTMCAENGDNAVVIYNNKPHIKGYFPQPDRGTVLLKAMNKAYAPIEVNVAEITVQGVIKALLPTPKRDTGFY